MTGSDQCRACSRPSAVAGLCGGHYRQLLRHPREPLRPLRPRGGMEEIKARVPAATAVGLRSLAAEERQSFPDTVRRALATYVGKARNRK